MVRAHHERPSSQQRTGTVKLIATWTPVWRKGRPRRGQWDEIEENYKGDESNKPESDAQEYETGRALQAEREHMKNFKQKTKNSHLGRRT